MIESSPSLFICLPAAELKTAYILPRDPHQTHPDYLEEIELGTTTAPSSEQVRKVSVLTGQIRERGYTAATPEEFRLLTIAKTVLEIATEGLQSPNYVRRTPEIQKKLQERQYTIKHFQEDLQKMRPNWEKIKLAEKENLPKFHIAELVSKYKIGNCEAMSLVGYFYLKAKHPEIATYLVIDELADHALLSIFPKPITSECRKRNSYEEGVFIDPWTGTYYPGSEVKNHTFDYLGQLYIPEEGGCPFPIFNPAKEEHIFEFTEPDREESL